MGYLEVCHLLSIWSEIFLSSAADFSFDSVVIREQTDIISFRFDETYFMAKYMVHLGEFLWTLRKKCVSCYCWVKYSINNS